MSTSAEWTEIEWKLMMRSSSKCEVQSPDCLTVPHVVNGVVVTGSLANLPRWRRSFHHRRPRGMGGTKRVDVDSLAALVNTCGDGVSGCHGYIESNRAVAFERGLLVPNQGTDEVTDPALVPLVLPSGRVVLLDPVFPWYNDPPNGPAYRDVPLPAGV